MPKLQYHPTYWKRFYRNKYVWDLYSGEALQEARRFAGLDSSHLQARRILGLDGQPIAPPLMGYHAQDLAYTEYGYYLYRRRQAEHADNYVERLQIARFPSYLATVFDSFTGAVSGVENDAVRTYVDTGGTPGPLGTPDDETSILYALERNADGDGANMENMMSSACGQFSRNKRVVYIVEGETDEHPAGRVMLIEPSRVVNWFPTTGPLTDVLIRDDQDQRTGVFDEYDPEKQYVRYTTTGYVRYREEGGELVEIPGTAHEWAQPWYANRLRTRTTLPIGVVELPLERDPALIMAYNQCALFNFDSDVRNVARRGGHNYLVGVGTDASERQDTKAEIIEGSGILFGDFSFQGPPSETLVSMYQTYRSQVEEFFTMAFSEFNDAAREKTATEMRIEEQRGRQAYLSLLASAMDELENQLYFFLAQAHAPDAPQTWGIAQVRRSRDFAPSEPLALAEKVTSLYFGENAVPAGRATLLQAQNDVIRFTGYSVTDESQQENEAAVDAYISRENAETVQKWSDTGAAFPAAVEASQGNYEQLTRNDFPPVVEQ